MRLVCLSDTHGLHARVAVPAGDVLVHAGDMTEHGTEAQVRDFLAWFATVGTFGHRLLIAGNHDLCFERAPARAEGLLPPGVTYLRDSGALVGGVRVWGSPMTPAYGAWAFGQQEAELARTWARIPPDTDVLLTHGPPRGTLDRVLPRGEAVGCAHLARAVSRVRPRLHVFGHIHEGHGRQAPAGTCSVNAAVCDAGYRLAHAPQVIDLPA